MTESEVASLSTHVLIGAFAVSAVFGAIAQRSNFCTMGAISDAVLMGDFTRAKQWAMAAAVACLGFASLVAIGGLDAGKTLYATARLLWLSAVVGGLLFGFGMVLASGCGSKTLIRIGAGNLKSLVVFLVLAVSAFASLKGIAAVARVATLDRVAIDTGSASSAFLAAASLGVPAFAAYLGLGTLILLVCVIWCWQSAEFRRLEVWLPSVVIGGAVTAMWWLSGSLGFVAEHPTTLEPAFVATASGRMESMSFVAPIAHSLDWIMFFSDKSKVLTFGVASVCGVLVGSFGMAVATRSFRWEGFRDAQDTALHIVGAVLMGVGGVTAMGCTVGQGLSGLSTLSWMSFIAVAAIILGGVLGIRFQSWLLERTA